MKEPAPIRVRVFFWFILGILSVFFAEVLSGSSPMAFFVPEGWLLIFPLYTLHILVLSYIVFTWGRATIENLFPAGMLLGMYEAYITKVLWYPPNVNFPKIGGVSLFSFPVLVLFWHPIMSFIIPLFLGESLLTSSREIFMGLHPWMKSVLGDARRVRRWLIILSILAGLVVGAQVKNIVNAFLSPLLSGSLIYLFIVLWKNIIGQRYTLRELLPRGKGFSISLTLLLILYIVLGKGMRARYLPDLSSQITIWFIYALIITLLIKNLKISKKAIGIRHNDYPFIFRGSPKWMIFGILLISFTATVSATISQIGWLFLVSVFIAGSGVGVLLLYYSIVYSFRSHNSISKAMGA